MLGRAMGLDVGNARIGIALSDPLQTIASPFSTIKNDGTALAEILKIIKEKNVIDIAVGLPLMLTGEIGEQASLTLAFVKKLEEKLKVATLENIAIHQIDERYTSAAAENVLVGSKLKNKALRSATDRIAASLILETYLQKKAYISSSR